MACTCGVLKPVQITKNSVNVPRAERSKTVMAEAFLFCAASTARRTVRGSVSSLTWIRSPVLCHLLELQDATTTQQAGAQLAAALRAAETPVSPVKALLKNVFLNARGNKSMNGLAALGAFARFRGGDVAGNSFEEIDGGCAEMRDELRGRDGIVFALGVGGSDEV